jgi:acetolactate decarboxylase
MSTGARDTFRHLARRPTAVPVSRQAASVAASEDAAVTYFRPRTVLSVSTPAGRADIVRLIDNAIGAANLIQGIRIIGTFNYVRTRTVMAPSPPYPPMTTATADEPITVSRKTPEDLAGFRAPEFGQGISVAGYHLHFLNETRNRGGHALDFELASGRIAISTSSELHLSLPRTQAFLTAKLSQEDLAEQIHRTEGG